MKPKGEYASMEILIAIITLAGIVVTTTGSVLVALIGNRKRAKEDSERNRTEILEAIKGVKTDLAANSRATVATTRGLISQVYTEYKKEKKLPEKTWRNVMDLYEAYKGIKIDGHTPNSWCDELVNEMKTWEKV